MYYLSLVAIAKNEKDLREWVAFHKIVGVEKITIYDNGSEIPIVETLHDYLASGLVRVVPFAGESMQMKAYDNYIQNYGQETTWCACIDADEYLFSMTEKTLPETLKDYQDFAGVNVCWRIFGSNNHITRPEGLVIENYTQAMTLENIENLHTKAVFQPAKTLRAGSNPHHFVYSEGLWSVSENYEPIPNAWAAKHSSTKLRINHYCLKSRQEFIDRRIDKPRADAAHLKGKTIEDFERFDRECTEEDKSAWKFLPALKSKSIVSHL